MSSSVSALAVQQPFKRVRIFVQFRFFLQKRGLSFLAKEQSVLSSVQIDGEEKGTLDPYLFFCKIINS